MAESLADEHARLKAEVAQLQREHDALEASQSRDAFAHAQHRASLRAKIDELRSHLARLKSDP
jgi:prefoldin subunit 5